MGILTFRRLKEWFSVILGRRGVELCSSELQNVRVSEFRASEFGDI